MTMKKLALLPLLFAATVSITAHAEEIRYVSDDLSTYVHSGPSNRYRIAGSLNSGEKVTVLDVNNESGFVRVRDSKNRDVWLPKELLSTTPSLKERVPAMEEEIKTLRGKLANIDGTWNDKTADMQNRVAASDDIINNLKKRMTACVIRLWSQRKNWMPSVCSWMTNSAILSCNGLCTAAV